MTITKLATTFAIGAALVAAAAGRARAQGGADVTDIEVPTVVIETGAAQGGPSGEGAEDIDLANVVQSAARAVTTVQEAPAIVTVITDDEIAERHSQRVDQLLDSVPGYLRVSVLHHMFPHASVRGQIQAAQLLHDGVSMFEPFVNVATQTEVQPMELIKRVEMITGPGGVLWGSNSLLGIINIITKDAEDVDGVEVGVRAGDGPGNPRYLHGYVMYGNPDLAGGKAKALVHLGFKTYKGDAMELPQHVFSAPLPQPNGPVLFGPLTTADPKQSFLFTSFFKVTMGKLQLRAQIPYYERHTPSTFSGFIVQENLPEDSRCMPTDNDAELGVPGDGCADQNRTSRDNEPSFFERYGVLEYRTRTADGRAGVTAKAYMVQFNRSFRVQVFPGIEGILEGGLAFDVDVSTYRPGTAIDGDVELPGNTRLLYGAEAFREFTLDDVKESRQGEGIEATFAAPYDERVLPLPCPLERDLPDNPGGIRYKAGCPLTISFPSSRTVLGAYLDPQWRPSKKLILDAGGRVQVAPDSLGANGYALTPTAAAAAVYNFIPNWHVKANFTQGFRPPAFNNLNSNGESVQLDGRPDLKVETTNAAQGEINARLFKGERRIRELNFRADYSYTQVKNLIQIQQGGRYVNAGDRGINSAEFLGKLYIQGGHRIELAYTWLDVDTGDAGKERVIPNNWFNLLAVFNIVDDKLSAMTNLRVIGAHEDFNRLVEYHNVHYCTPEEASAATCMDGDVVNAVPGQSYQRVGATDLVLDRLPAVAELMFGLAWHPSPKLEISGEVFNALDNLGYQPDVFFTQEPRLEFLPNPYERFRAYLGATYSY